MRNKLVVGIVIVAAAVVVYFFVDSRLNNETENPLSDELSEEKKEGVSADNLSGSKIQGGQFVKTRDYSALSGDNLGDTPEARAARQTMIAEMEHALTPSSASDVLKLRALNEAGNIEGRVKTVYELETSKPRGFVSALIAVSAAIDPLVKQSAADALGRSYFPEALQRLNVMIQDSVQHPSVREGVLSAITALAKASSEKLSYPSPGANVEGIAAETRAVLLKQLGVAASLKDGREISTTIQILEALSYLNCPEFVAIVQAKLRESYADYPERDALVVALGRSGFSAAQTVLEEYQNHLEEVIAKSTSSDPMVLQVVRNSLELVQKTRQSSKAR